MPLLIWPVVFFTVDDFTERNATNRPEELIEGNKLSVALKSPPGSTEINWVCDVQPEAAPLHVSRRKICLPLGVCAARFVAAELNAM